MHVEKLFNRTTSYLCETIKELLTLAVMAIFVGEFLEKEAIDCRHLICFDGGLINGLSMASVDCRHLICFDGGLINGLSMGSVDSLHGNLKVARRPLGAKHDKAAF